MNERFEQLKRRAVAEADTSHIDFDNMSHSEIQMLGDIAVERKFAELIVFECTKAVMDGTKEGDHYAQKIEEHFDNSTDGILHFGVEE